MSRTALLARQNKAVALMMALVMLLTAVFGSTFAYIATQAPSLFNTFISGIDPTGDLIIWKEVSHPFGDGYRIPDNIFFGFTVDLGEKYAGRTLITSQGEKTVDENGSVAVTIKSDETFYVKDLAEGMVVTVTETQTGGPGFVMNGENPKIITLQRGNNDVILESIYTPGPVNPVNLNVAGIKELDGRDWQVGDSFAFSLEYKLAGQGNEWQLLGMETVTYDPANPEFDQFSFTEQVQGVEYTICGEYAFRVSEVEGSVGGVTYDKVISYFDVLVGDADMNGSLEIQNVIGHQNASVAYDETAAAFNVNVTINNTYAPVGTATAMIEIGKTVWSLSGEEKSFAGYTFDLYDTDGNLIRTSGETSAAGETVIELTYEAKDAGRTFDYVLKETNCGSLINGMLYDSTEYRISVFVKDNLDGTLSAVIYNTKESQEESSAAENTDAAGEGSTEETEGADVNSEEIEESYTDTYKAEFVNVYDPVDAQVVIEGNKKLYGRGLSDGEFRFNLYATGDTFLVSGDMEPIRTAVNTKAGAFVFDVIPYDRVGIYRYVVKEDSTVKLGGVAYDEAVFRVVVSVVDENGSLAASVDVTDEIGQKTNILFCNNYSAEKASVAFSGTMKLTGKELKENMFDFLLFKADENFTPLGAVMDGSSNAADGSFVFNEIEYFDIGQHFYVVTANTSEQEAGFTYDKTVYGIKVDVWDNGQGQLVADVTLCKDNGSGVEEIFFEFSYKKPNDPSNPQTGDNSTVELYALMAFVSIAVIIALPVINKRRKK